jgi:selenophosphate synthetase-related protein
VVDALFSGDPETAHQILDGMNRAVSRLGIPVVGGHTNLRSPYAALAVAIVGRSRSLITSFDARPGDDVIVGIDLRGKKVAGNPFWDATDAPPARMREDYELLPKLAEARLVRAGKDISMAGVVGSLLMLIESSGVGANLALDRIPRPPEIDLAGWLVAFPSYGFVLAVEPSSSDEVTAAFSSRGIASAVVGSVDASRTLTLSSGDEREVVWDLGREGLTQAEGAKGRHA